MRRTVRLPSPAMVVALIALFVALGGSAYAAKKITAKDIRTGAVGTRAVKNHSLAGTDIRNNSLGPGTVSEQGLDTSKFNVAKLKTVPRARVAAAVPKDTIGAAELGVVTRRFGAVKAVANGTATTAGVNCAKGEIAVGGGGRWSEDVAGVGLSSSYAGSDGSWTVAGTNGSGAPRRLQAFAMCLAP
jgi:hypothetical protein